MEPHDTPQSAASFFHYLKASGVVHTSAEPLSVSCKALSSVLPCTSKPGQEAIQISRVDSWLLSDSEQVSETSSDECAADVTKLCFTDATDESDFEEHSSGQEWTPENSGEQKTLTVVVPETSSDDSSDQEWTLEFENSRSQETSTSVVLETSYDDSSHEEQESTPEISGSLKTSTTVVPKTKSEVQKSFISVSQNPLPMNEVTSTTGSGTSNSADSFKQDIHVKGTEGKKWDKKHACKFCGKMVIKMSDHLQRVHGDELEVVRVLAMEKGSLCRKRAWSELLKEGDYEHNFKVLQNEEGEYIPKYRSRKQRVVKDFLPCHICKGSYKRSLLYLHVERCGKEHKIEVTKKRKEAITMGELLCPVAQVGRLFREKVIQKMSEDDIKRIVFKDTLILQHGERKFLRKDIQEHTANNISSSLRLLGKLVKVLQRNDIMSLTQALHAGNFSKLLAAVREICEFDEDTNHLKKGHTARKIGYSLQHCCSILKSEAAKNQDADLMQQAIGFEAAFTGDWSDFISSCASQSIETQKFNNQKLIPTCKDVEKLYLYLKDLSAHAGEDEQYSDLAQRTLCQIHMLNRKRGGEVQRMKVVDYKTGVKKPSDVDPVIEKSLDDIEVKLANFLQRIEIRGKFGRRVAILLTPQMCRNLDRLLQLKKKASITSQYMFATKTGQRPFRGSDVIRRFVKEAKVENSDLFTWTALRKQVATISQVMEITDTDQDLLANFLNHDIRVHREYYRLPVSLLQKARVAKFLLGANRGADLSAERLQEELDSETAVDPEEPLPQFDNDAEHDEADTSNDEGPCPKLAKERAVHRSKSTKSDSGKRKWSAEECAAVHRQLQPWIEMCRVPKKEECEEALKKESALRQRNWRAIKFFVYNLIQKKNKKDR